MLFMFSGLIFSLRRSCDGNANFPSIFLLAKTLPIVTYVISLRMKTMPGAVPPAFVTTGQPKDTTCARSPARCAGITSLGNALAAASSPVPLSHRRDKEREGVIFAISHTVTRPSDIDVYRCAGSEG